jgi:hypothetical protein
MEEIKKAVAMIGRVVGAILGKGTTTPSSQSRYDYPTGRLFF